MLYHGMTLTRSFPKLENLARVFSLPSRPLQTILLEVTRANKPPRTLPLHLCASASSTHTGFILTPPLNHPFLQKACRLFLLDSSAFEIFRNCSVQQHSFPRIPKGDKIPGQTDVHKGSQSTLSSRQGERKGLHECEPRAQLCAIIWTVLYLLRPRPLFVLFLESPFAILLPRPIKALSFLSK